MLRFFAGLFLGMSLSAALAEVADECGTYYDEENSYMAVRVPTNGVLKGYIVPDKSGNEVCRDPGVWNEFRGPDSYIVCDVGG
jgi:hypothetical protein